MALFESIFKWFWICLPNRESSDSKFVTQSNLQNPPRFDEDVELPLIKVVVLGASGVGKTALVKVAPRRKKEVKP